MKLNLFERFSAAALLMVLTCSAGCAETGGETVVAGVCPIFPSEKTLSLLPIYHDANSSIPDVDAEKHNREATAKIDNFLNYAQAALDAPNASPQDSRATCAYRNFKQWAKSGALTVEPAIYNTEGKVKRSEYDVGFDLVALKFEAAGFVMDAEALRWLHAMNDESRIFWDRASNRGNLRILGAQVAALDAVLQHNSAALEFQDRVWREAMAAIHDDGTIDAEMTRGQRALIYHGNSFSNTLILRAAREAPGYRTTPQDRARLALLANMIGHARCDPHDIERKAGAVQEFVVGPGIVGPADLRQLHSERLAIVPRNAMASARWSSASR